MNSGDKPIQLLLSAREARQALSVSEKTLFNLTEPRGSLRCVRFCCGPKQKKISVRYHIDDLRSWIAQRKEAIGE